MLTAYFSTGDVMKMKKLEKSISIIDVLDRSQRAMTQRVWLYPDRTFEELGAERFRVTWEEVKASAKDSSDIDPDEDILYCSKSFKTKAPALKAARALIQLGKTAFGEVTVTKQVVGWYVEEDRIAEWQDTSEIEYVDSGTITKTA